MKTDPYNIRRFIKNKIEFLANDIAFDLNIYRKYVRESLILIGTNLMLGSGEVPWKDRAEFFDEIKWDMGTVRAISRDYKERKAFVIEAFRNRTDEIITVMRTRGERGHKFDHIMDRYDEFRGENFGRKPTFIQLRSIMLDPKYSLT